MELTYVDGCVCTSLAVDGVETVDMEIGKLREVVKALFKLEYECQEERDESLSYYINEIIDETADSYWEYYDEKENCYHTAYSKAVGDTVYRHVVAFYRDLTFIGYSLYGHEAEMLEEKDFEALCGLIDGISDVGTLQGMFCHTLERYGDYSCTDEPCECCGDYVRTYALHLDEKGGLVGKG